MNLLVCEVMIQEKNGRILLKKDTPNSEMSVLDVRVVYIPVKERKTAYEKFHGCCIHSCWVLLSKLLYVSSHKCYPIKDCLIIASFAGFSCFHVHVYMV